MLVTDKFVLFWGDYLGNWTKSPKEIIYLDKNWAETNPATLLRKFPTSEHLFMYLKAVHYKDWETAKKILAVESPKEAKKLGREVKGFDQVDWEKVREDMMFTAIINRGGVDEKYRNMILNPDWLDLEFVEASPYDKVWGIGLPQTDPNANDKSKWPGLNLLGKCLCEARRFWLFQEEIDKFEEHAFFESMIWCPSAIEYYFTDPTSGKMYVLYLRWRYSDPWSADLVEVADPSNPKSWNFQSPYENITDKLGFFKDDEYEKLEEKAIKYLESRFPAVTFPKKPKHKNPESWTNTMNFV